MSHTAPQANAHTNFSPPVPAPGRASSRPKRWLTAIAISALALSTVVMDAETAAATGTPADCFIGTTEPSTAPTQDGSGVYPIASKENLVWVSWATSANNAGTAPSRAEARAASYKQTANIDLEGCNWAPIGDFSSQFTGQFDGGGHTIAGLTIAASTAKYVGLFGRISGAAKLQNIGLVDVSVTGDDYVGGLAGYNDGTIEDSYATGAVTGDYYVGGLAGLSDGTITDSYATGRVTGREDVGGLVGYEYGGTITNSYATGPVTALDNVGGLVGYVDDYGTTITNSYATGDVNGDDYVGGLVGYVYEYGTITNSYATGEVTGDDFVGGLVGLTDDDVFITNSYATGDVTGNSDVGGLVGFNDEEIRNSYATGKVTGDLYVGGLVGRNSDPIKDSYATGEVIGNSDVGGLVGTNRNAVRNSYSTGKVTGTLNVGGLVGSKSVSSTTTDSFWDITTSGQGTSVEGTGKTTADMNAFATFAETDTVGLTIAWAIVSTWEAFSAPERVWGISPAVNSGYPYLLWQLSAAPNAAPVFSSGTTGPGVAGTASDVYTAVASDADNDAVTYSLDSAVAGFTIDSSTGVVSMAASVAAGSYVLTVVASDGTDSVTQMVTVTVTVSAASAPSADAGLALDRSVGQPIAGAGVDYFLDGLQVGSTWTLTLRSTPQIIASGIVDGSGIVRGTAVIPAGLAAGWHSITLTGTNILGTAVNEVLWFELNGSGVITAKQNTAPVLPAAVLARTGSDIGGLLAGALALLMAGLLAVGFTRRQEKGLLAD